MVPKNGLEIAPSKRGQEGRVAAACAESGARYYRRVTLSSKEAIIDSAPSPSRPLLLPGAYCLVAAALFGASTPLSKHLLTELGPFSLAGLLYLGAALAVAPFAGRQERQTRRSRASRQVVYLVLAVVAGGIVGPVFLLFGLRAAQSASVSLWLNLETAATALFAFLFFREHLGWRTWLATAGIVGAGLVLALPGGAAAAAAGGFVALACAAWALDNNVTSLIDGFTPAQSTLIKGIVAGTFNLALGIATEGVDAGPMTLGLALAVGGLGYGLSLVLYIKGAQEIGATRSQLLFSAAPFVGVAIAWVGLGEALLPEQVVAGALIAASIGLLLKSEHAHPHDHGELDHIHSHRHDDGHHNHRHPGQPLSLRHTHEHHHSAHSHSHPHVPDLHHRHDHGG